MVSRRRKQGSAWRHKDRPPSTPDERPVRRAARRPVRTRFKLSSLAWIGGGAAAAVGVLSILIAGATNHPASQLPAPTVAAGNLTPRPPPPAFTATTPYGR